jgi:uncharacterized OB-fold protein
MENENFTIKQFLNFIKQGELKAVKCKKCSAIILPPKFKCSLCETLDFEWVSLNGKGKLLTYSVIYVPPKRFKEQAPYAIGIVELKEGVKVEARLKGFNVENHEKELNTGMELEFESDPEGILSFKVLK